MVNDLRKGPSGPAVDPDFGKVVIQQDGVDQGVAGVLDFAGLQATVDEETSTATIAPIIASGNNPGYLNLHVYANPSSALIGTEFWGVVVEAAPATFTAAMLDEGGQFDVICWGAGASGPNGRFQNAAGAATAGGSGPGGGSRRCVRVARASFLAALPAAMVVAPEVAPPANSTNAGAVNTGNFGSFSRLGALCLAYGGGGGFADGSARAGGGGGGWTNPGNDATSALTNFGGGSPVAGTFGLGGAGAGGLTATTFAGGLPSAGGGGASGGICQVGNIGLPGGCGNDGGGAGGASGGLAAGATASDSRAGGAGGSSGMTTAHNGNGGAGGIAGSPGGDGAPGINAVSFDRSGAGGGGGASSPAVGQPGGAGGRGGIPAGAGGAGAPGRGANGTPFGGPGGIGAEGLIAIVGWP